METLKQVTDPTATQAVNSEEKYRVVAPEAMHETFMSDSEEEGGKIIFIQINIGFLVYVNKIFYFHNTFLYYFPNYFILLLFFY